DANSAALHLHRLFATLSPLRGNNAQDHKRATATKFWESDKLRDNKRIQADAQYALMILGVMTGKAKQIFSSSKVNYPPHFPGPLNKPY
ncbi:hypothetical protein, partial [Desulfofustis glycolicus]